MPKKWYDHESFKNWDKTIKECFICNKLTQKHEYLIVIFPLKSLVFCQKCWDLKYFL